MASPRFVIEDLVAVGGAAFAFILTWYGFRDAHRAVVEGKSMGLVVTKCINALGCLVVGALLITLEVLSWVGVVHRRPGM